jgi:hypothetical protein
MAAANTIDEETASFPTMMLYITFIAKNISSRHMRATGKKRSSAEKGLTSLTNILIDLILSR